MPVEARGKEIVEKSTKKVVGKSKTPEMAQRAARVRNAIHETTKAPAYKGPRNRVVY